MSKSFDYVKFAKEFEVRHGRPPTASELEKGVDPLEVLDGVVTFRSVEETQAEIERINTSYKPSFSERIKDGLSFLGRNGLKAFLLLLTTPIYLTLFFFNLIKSTIAVFIVWFVSKFMLGLIVGLIANLIYGSQIDGNPFPSPIKEIINFLLGDELFKNAVPNFFTHPTLDACIIGIFIIFFAFAATFSKTEV